MTQPQEERAERQPGAGRPVSDPGEQVPDPGENADFASEHTSPTFADQQRGGLEEDPETESPEGYAGMDRGRLYWRGRDRDDDQDGEHTGEQDNGRPD